MIGFIGHKTADGEILFRIKILWPNASLSKGESEQNSLANQSSITNQNILASQSAVTQDGGEVS